MAIQLFTASSKHQNMFSSRGYTFSDGSKMEVFNVLVTQLCWLFATPWTVVHPAPLSMEFSRQEYWSGLPCPPLGDLPSPGIKPASLPPNSLYLLVCLLFEGWPPDSSICKNHYVKNFIVLNLFFFLMIKIAFLIALLCYLEVQYEKVWLYSCLDFLENMTQWAVWLSWSEYAVKI